MKNVYMFYIHDSAITSTKYPGVHYKDIVHVGSEDFAFYAWTNDKYIRKTFKKLRKSDLFVERTFETSDADYEKFETNNPDTKLLTIPVTTKCDSPVNTDTPLIISTRREMDYIIFHQNTIFEEILSPERYDINVKLVSPMCFASKYKKVLTLSGFNNIIKMIYAEKPEDKRAVDMNLDILALYISIYKDLYKGEML